MLKASLGYIEAEQATVLVFGLSENNLTALIEQHRPIIVKSEVMGLPEPGADIVFFGAKDKQEIGDQIKKMYTQLSGNEEGDLGVLYIANKFYVIPFSNKDGRQLFMVGLDNNSRQLLSKGERFMFRCREMKGSHAIIPIELVIFSGKDEATMTEMFNKGLQNSQVPDSDPEAH